MSEEIKKPHVSFNTGNNEWYTPQEYVEAARAVMGSIDTDPASAELAQETVKAKVYYTIETNGLEKPWKGNVFLNPPYTAKLVKKFCEKAVQEYGAGNATQIIVLVNNATETTWFHKLTEAASAVCFPAKRIRFYGAEGEKGQPLQGQAFVYIGGNSEGFIQTFKRFGWCAKGVKKWEI